MAAYALNAETLREAAARIGDHSLYRISKRTGLNLGNLSKILKGEWSPSLDTALRLAAAYGLTVEQLVTAQEVEALSA